MTKEEAKSFLIAISYDLGNMAVEDLSEKDGEKMREAIKELEQQPCEDCISRQALIEKATSWDKHFADSERCVSLTDIQNAPSVQPQTKNLSENEVNAFVDSMKSVRAEVDEPQLKRGKWIHREDMDYLDKNKVIHNHFMCQNCGFVHDFIDGHTAQYKYCPSCGEDMREVQG